MSIRWISEHSKIRGRTDKLGQYDEAIEIYDLILQSKPDKQTTRFNKSMCVLLKSEFKAGFRIIRK